MQYDGAGGGDAYEEVLLMLNRKCRQKVKNKSHLLLFYMVKQLLSER